MAYDVGPRDEPSGAEPEDTRVDALADWGARLCFAVLLGLVSWWGISSIWTAVRRGFGL